MHKYSLEFILHIRDVSTDMVKNSIMDFGQDIDICELHPGKNPQGKDIKINIRTEDPTIIFDTCAEFGRIKSVKIN